MATAGVVDALIKEFECSVCMDRLQNPKCLFCQHVFCRDCLEKSVQSGRDEANAITCPVCRVVTRVPRGGVDALKTNPLINNVLEKLSVLEKDRSGIVLGSAAGGQRSRNAGVGCESCHCPAAVGDFFCKDCDLFICYGCLTQASQSHDNVVPRSEVDSDWEKTRGTKACEKHTSMRSQFYCPTCDRLCCHTCVNSEHRRHKTVPLHKKVSSINSTMQNLVDRCHEKNFAIQATHHEVNMKKDEVVEVLQKLKSEVGQKAEKLVAKVKDKEQELIRRLEGITTEVEQEMEGKQAQCQEVEEELQAAVESWEALKRSGNDADIVKKMGSIQKKMEDLLKSSISSKSNLTDIVQTACFQFTPGDLYLAMTNGWTLGEIRAGRFWNVQYTFDPVGIVSQLMYTNDGRLVIGNVSDGIQIMDRGRERRVEDFLDDERIRDLAVLGNNDIVFQDNRNEVHLLRDGDERPHANLGEFNGQWVSISSFVNKSKLLIAVYVAERYVDEQKIIIMDTKGKKLEELPMNYHHGVRNVTFDCNRRPCFIDFNRKGVHWPDLRSGGPERLQISEEGREYLAAACNQSAFVYVASQKANDPNVISITKHSLDDGRKLGVVLSDYTVESGYRMSLANWKDEEIAFNDGQTVKIVTSKKYQKATELLDRY